MLMQQWSEFRSGGTTEYLNMKDRHEVYTWSNRVLVLEIVLVGPVITCCRPNPDVIAKRAQLDE